MADISRRKFIEGGLVGAAALGAAGLAGCSSPQSRSDSSSGGSGSTSGAAIKDDSWMGEAPDITPDQCDETVDTDVVVVGAALAGSMAAYGAMKNGANVIVLERNSASHIGGMTISFFNSNTQREAGVPMYDPIETANKMFYLTQNMSDMRLNAVWIERSGGLLDQLRTDFLEPYNQYYQVLSLEGIFPDPTQEISSYISTGVAFSHDDILTDFTHNFHQYLQDQGVQFEWSTRGEKLQQDDSGAVTGVIATQGDRHIYYHANKGVVMATGSFGANETMMRRFYPPYYAEWALENNAYNAYMGSDPVDETMDDGLGHRMLGWAGARMEEICGTLSWQSTAWRSFPYLLVDTKGERFMNECTSLLASSHIIADLPGHGNYVWQIIPTNDFQMPSSFGYNREQAATMFNIEQTEHYQADTLEELADMIDVPRDTFVATVQHYNDLCNAGADTDYMKARRYLDAIDDPPYQAWKMIYNFYCTLSGVRCNEHLQVVDENFDPIPGLYAGGNTVGYRFGDDYETLLHGGSNGLAATHGYVAGESAANA